MWIKVIAIILAFELPNLDGCPASRPRRTRVYTPRRQTTRRLGCFDQNGNKVARCTKRMDEEMSNITNGCPNDLLGMDCWTKMGYPHTRDQFTIVCNGTAEDCVKHEYSSPSFCHPCCRVRDFEGPAQIRPCGFIPQNDDICPHHSIGCPMEDMKTIWSTEERERNCELDHKCNTIMDVSEDIANSGVNCWETQNPERENVTTYCCNNRNVITNVPICEDAPHTTGIKMITLKVKNEDCGLDDDCGGRNIKLKISTDPDTGSEYCSVEEKPYLLKNYYATWTGDQLNGCEGMNLDQVYQTTTVSIETSEPNDKFGIQLIQIKMHDNTLYEVSGVEFIDQFPSNTGNLRRFQLKKVWSPT